MFVKFNEQNMASHAVGFLTPEDNPSEWTVVPDTLMSARRIIKVGDVIRAATDAEIEAELVQLRTQALANKLRWERDQALTLSDSLVLPDRWAKFTSAQQAAITKYREDLRNLPQQAGFPLEATIPAVPAL